MDSCAFVSHWVNIWTDSILIHFYLVWFRKLEFPLNTSPSILWMRYSNLCLNLYPSYIEAEAISVSLARRIRSMLSKLFFDIQPTKTSMWACSTLAPTNLKLIGKFVHYQSAVQIVTLRFDEPLNHEGELVTPCTIIDNQFLTKVQYRLLIVSSMLMKTVLNIV